MKNISALANAVEQTVTVSGFLENLRDLKKMQFLVIADRGGSIQAALYKPSAEKKLVNTISALTEGSVVTITGELKKNPKVKLNGLELSIQSLKVESKAKPSLPINEDSALDKKLDWPHLYNRSDKRQLTLKVQSTIEQAMREYWYANGYMEIHTPKLMGTASESGAELFEVPYFNGKQAYLAQSPQFYKQMAIASNLDRIFEIGPVFRADPSNTPRHETEFVSVDMEFSGVTSHEDVMAVEEAWLAHVLSVVKEKHGDAIKEVFDVDVIVPTLPFPRISLAEALDILKDMGHVIEHKDDLDPQGERLIYQYVKEQYRHEFVFVTEYPASVRPFYHMRNESNPKLTKSFDLIWKGLEITTGAQREHRIDILEAQLEEKGIKAEPLADYLNSFRYGCPPHGGFGLGLARLTMLTLGLSAIREVVFVSRNINRLTP